MIKISEVVSVTVNKNIIHLKFWHMIKTKLFSNFPRQCTLNI